eukprot:31030-Prorocentrum_minimum.AAC.1
MRFEASRGVRPFHAPPPPGVRLVDRENIPARPASDWLEPASASASAGSSPLDRFPRPSPFPVAVAPKRMDRRIGRRADVASPDWPTR